MSNAPHIRLKYVNDSYTPSGSWESLSAISGVNVAAMCTKPISIMPMDNAFVMFVLFSFIVVDYSLKELISIRLPSGSAT